MTSSKKAATRPRVAVIGTGGTIASLGRGPLDISDYSAAGNIMAGDALVARVPELAAVADIRAVPFRNIASTQLGWNEWKEMLRIADKLVKDDPTLAGIVITHGTATLEETAYFLSLAAKVPVPIVVLGAQRPASALSGDGPLNLVNAVRVAASPQARGLGALVVMNDEIHAAREVTKTSTQRLQTFRTADFGVLGHADADGIHFYRRPLRRLAPDTEFDIRRKQALPRVDIAYSYADADGTAVRAYLAAGAKGLVVAGFAPAGAPAAMMAALDEAVASGVPVVMATRAGSGRVPPLTTLKKRGFVPADNLTPQKARILLMLGLTVSKKPAEIARIFATY